MTAIHIPLDTLIHTQDTPYCGDPQCPCRDETRLTSPGLVVETLRRHTARLQQIKDEHLEHPGVRASQVGIFAMTSIWASTPEGALKTAMGELLDALQNASL